MTFQVMKRSTKNPWTHWKRHQNRLKQNNLAAIQSMSKIWGSRKKMKRKGRVCWFMAQKTWRPKSMRRRTWKTRSWRKRSKGARKYKTMKRSRSETKNKREEKALNRISSSTPMIRWSPTLTVWCSSSLLTHASCRCTSQPSSSLFRTTPFLF